MQYDIDKQQYCTNIENMLPMNLWADLRAKDLTPQQRCNILGAFCKRGLRIENPSARLLHRLSSIVAFCEQDWCYDQKKVFWETPGRHFFAPRIHFFFENRGQFLSPVLGPFSGPKTGDNFGRQDHFPHDWRPQVGSIFWPQNWRPKFGHRADEKWAHQAPKNGPHLGTLGHRKTVNSPSGEGSQALKNKTCA